MVLVSWEDILHLAGANLVKLWEAEGNILGPHAALDLQYPALAPLQDQRSHNASQ